MGKNLHGGVKLTQSSAGEETKTKKVKNPSPTKVGEADKAGYVIEGTKDNRVVLRTPTGKFGVYSDAWTKDEKSILRPVKDKAVAMSVLETGKKPEKPAKAEKSEKAPKAEKAPKPDK